MKVRWHMAALLVSTVLWGVLLYLIVSLLKLLGPIS